MFMPRALSITTVDPARYSDPFDSLSAFTQTNSGSGIVISSSEAAWTGGSEGFANAMYNTPSITNDQYIACTIGGYTSSSRVSAIYFHDDGMLGGYYAVGFTTSTLRLVYQAGGTWQSIGNTEYGVSGGISSGDFIEGWNIGENFYVAVNGSTVISTTISGAQIQGRRSQGIGMCRASFNSSTRMADWRGGDAAAWGKI